MYPTLTFKWLNAEKGRGSQEDVKRREQSENLAGSDTTRAPLLRKFKICFKRHCENLDEHMPEADNDRHDGCHADFHDDCHNMLAAGGGEPPHTYGIS
jgi:hypothetical protein